MKDLPEPGEEELALFMQIVDEITTDLASERTIMAARKDRGPDQVQDEMQVCPGEGKKSKKPVSKSMMEARRNMVESWSKLEYYGSLYLMLLMIHRA